MTIIDSHTHIDEAGFWVDPPETIIRLMDEAEVAKAIVMTYRDAPKEDEGVLEYVAEACARYPGRLIGYARMNPHAGERAILAFEKAIKDYKMKGLKLHPVSTLAHPAGDATIELVKRAAELGAPVLFHCGDEEMTLPLQVARTAQKVPEATIIFGHCGGYHHVSDAIRVAKRLPNVVLETSAMPYPALIKAAVDAIGAERILFASDGPGCDPSIEVRKVKLAGLTPEQEELIFHRNIATLMNKVKA